MRSRARLTASQHRLGFTLVELLVVIVILGLLVGLLLPAVMRAVNTANTAAVSAEIQSLSQALAAFKTQYGDYPPSRIVIAEDGDYSPGTLSAVNPALINRSVQALRKFWPRMPIRTDGTKPVISGGWFDVNGDTVLSAAYILQGHEALCIFLGGVPMQTDTGFSMMGFSKDPTNPFQGAIPRTATGLWPYSNNRTVPLMEFKPGNLKPTLNSSLPSNAGPLPGYVDRFGGFFAYFSAYGGVGYDPDDVNIAEPDDDGTTLAILGGLQSNNDPGGGGNTTRGDLVKSQSPNPYTNDAPLPVAADGTINLTDTRPKQYFNANTYQIISAGADVKFGIGGQWNQKGSVTLPFYPSANQSVTGLDLSANIRSSERDNVTNFSGGKLE